MSKCKKDATNDWNLLKVRRGSAHGEGFVGLQAKFGEQLCIRLKKLGSRVDLTTNKLSI